MGFHNYSLYRYVLSIPPCRTHCWTLKASEYAPFHLITDSASWCSEWIRIQVAPSTPVRNSFRSRLSSNADFTSTKAKYRGFRSSLNSLITSSKINDQFIGKEWRVHPLWRLFCFSSIPGCIRFLRMTSTFFVIIGRIVMPL